jgi:hypothetical protein
MTTTHRRRPPARLALLAALAGAVSAYRPLHPVEAAPPAASASAAPPASAAAPEARGVPVSAYAWPTEVGAEPTEEEWAGATVLETITLERQDAFPGVVCRQAALGAWLRVTCTDEPRRFGVIWGLAGDSAKVKGRFTLASEVEHHDKPPTTREDEMERKMGASATLTIPVTPGSAALLRLDRIAWAEEYEFAGVTSGPGMLIDISWALGEKHPTILYR